MDQQHLNAFQALQAWIKSKKDFLNDKPAINSIADAEIHIALWETFKKENVISLFQATVYFALCDFAK